MAEDDTLGHALRLASGTDSDNANYQVVLFQRGDASTYEDYIGQSESDLKSAYGVISPRKVKITVDGATVTAVRLTMPSLPPWSTTAAMSSTSPA